MTTRSMKILGAACVAMAVVFGAARFRAAQHTPSYQFQEAIDLMETKGDYPAAIRVFEELAKGADRNLAARSLLYMGICYEKLGKDGARKAYERVVRDYADQSEAATEARTRLAALAGGNNAKRTELATRRVWAGPDVDILGAVSPDGRSLTFVDWQTGDLALRDLSTGKNRRLTNKGSWVESIEFAMSSVPAPDGNHVAYTWFNKNFGFDLRVVALDGSPPRVLCSNPEVDYPVPAAFTPDGQDILAVFTRKDRTNQIVLVSVAKGSVRVLKSLDWRYPAKMSLSTDGQFVVYDFPPKENFPQRDIFLLATDGSLEIPLVQHPANDLFPVWAPDGKSVVFASDRTGTMGLWTIRVANGKPQGAPELLKPDIGRISPMAFTKGGSLYYGLNTGMTDVYMATLDPATGVILEPPAPVSQRFVGSNRYPDWSPDGNYLAYVSQRGPGSPQAPPSPIIVRTLASGEERELVPSLSSSGRPRWSPDGRGFLVFGQDTRGRVGFYWADGQTGDANLLVPLEPSPYRPSPVWSPDGKEIFYTYVKGKETQLRMWNLESGKEEVLYRGNALSLAVSPDGQWLAFTVPQEMASDLMIVPIAGGSPRKLLGVRPPEQIPLGAVAWTRDGNYLLFARGSRQQPASLWRVPAQGGEPQKLNLTMEGLTGLRVHPDGRRIAFTAGVSKSEVWVMENFLPVERASR